MYVIILAAGIQRQRTYIYPVRVFLTVHYVLWVVSYTEDVRYTGYRIYETSVVLFYVYKNRVWGLSYDA
jgi:hypothetical protein